MCAVLIALASILACAPASAAPVFDIEAASGAAFTVNTPRFEHGKGTLHLAGSVCRRAFVGGALRYVRVERISQSGAVIDVRSVRINGAPGYRGGCGYYSLDLSAPSTGERLRLSAHAGR